MSSARVGVGIRVKTAKGIAVVLAGPPSAPRIVLRRQLVLWDPKVETSAQPYHAGLGLEEKEAAKVVGRASRAVRRVSKSAVRSLCREVAGAVADVRNVVLVRSSATDPESVRNPHMHAHAAEGLLFFEALAEGSIAAGADVSMVLEKAALESAAKALGRGKGAVVDRIAAFGKEVGAPWRADEKVACAAAWLALHEG